MCGSRKNAPPGKEEPALPSPELLNFYLWSAVTLAGALGVVFSKRIVYSALSLIVSLFGVAALYVMLYAPFLAAVQILLYVGGIAVLMLFGVVVAQQTVNRPLVNTNRQSLISFIVVVVFVVTIGRILTSVQWPESEREGKTMFSSDVSQIWPRVDGQTFLAHTEYNPTVIGRALSETYVMPFILASLILL
ncbi:MAG: NADH-quinone oxidoreductase subunit J family protein, partial [bacterium]